MARTLKTLTIIFLLGSCVPVKRFNTAVDALKDTRAELDLLWSKVRELEAENLELTEENQGFSDELSRAVQDTIRLASDLHAKQEALDRVKSSYETLSEQLAAMQKSRSSEVNQLLEQLADLRKTLGEKETVLDNTIAERNKERSELAAKRLKIEELEALLAQKDKKMRELKKAVNNALLGFKNQGLKVYEKNGKLYVSLDERLLFKSGSYAVNKKGAEALRALAGVLESQKDVSIMVEGHTDNIPYRSTGDIEDNWDLSVHRATAVIRILLSTGKIEGSRLVAAGRSKYEPIDRTKTQAARATNRRTEVILTPNLGELMKLFEEAQSP